MKRASKNSSGHPNPTKGRVKSKSHTSIPMVLAEEGDAYKRGNRLHLSVGEYEAYRLYLKRDKLSAAFGIGELAARCNRLADAETAFQSVLAASSAAYRWKTPISIDHAIEMSRGDSAALEMAAAMSPAMLLEILAHFPTPRFYKLINAVALDRGDQNLMRASIAAQKSATNTRSRSVGWWQYRLWLPLLLWLVSDKNGADLLAKVSGLEVSKAGYQKSRERLRLYQSKFGFQFADLGSDGRIIVQPSNELKRALSQISAA